MSISLLFKNIPKKKIGAVNLDATLSEKHTRTAVVSDFPVEEGANVADHIRVEPEELSIEGMITNAPVSMLFGGGIYSLSKPVQRGFADLEKMIEARQPVTVVTGLKKYSDMAITSLSFPRDKDTGEALFFSIDLKKIRKVSSKTVTISEAQVGGSKKIKDQAQSQKDAGKQGTKAADGKTTESALHSAFGSVVP